MRHRVDHSLQASMGVETSPHPPGVKGRAATPLTEIVTLPSATELVNHQPLHGALQTLYPILGLRSPPPTSLYTTLHQSAHRTALQPLPGLYPSPRMTPPACDSAPPPSDAYTHLPFTLVLHRLLRATVPAGFISYTSVCVEMSLGTCQGLGLVHSQSESLAYPTGWRCTQNHLSLTSLPAS